MAYDIRDDMEGLLTSITSDIYGETPADIDNVIVVTPTGGYTPSHTFDHQKPSFTRPSFQVLVRHLSADTANVWLDGIKTALDGKTNYSVNGKTYILINQQSDVLDMGRDNRINSSNKF